MIKLAVIAIILPLSLGGCAAGYSSEKGWYAGAAVTPKDMKAIISTYRE